MTVLLAARWRVHVVAGDHIRGRSGMAHYQANTMPQFRLLQLLELCRLMNII